MSKDLNLCQFIGRLGKDPEVRYTPDGKAVANFSIACSDDYKAKSGEKIEQTNWIKIVAWGRLAEICGEYLKKGSQVYIAGKQVTRKWQDKDGNDRYSTESGRRWPSKWDVVVEVRGRLRGPDRPAA